MFGRLFTILAIIFVGIIHVCGNVIFGRVSDNNGTPIEFANVAVISCSDSAFIVGEVTDANGTFNFMEINPQKEPFMIKVRALGYQDSWESFIGNPCEITLRDSLTTLNEIVVNGSRNIFRQTSTGIKMRVIGTYLSDLASTAEILDHVPGLFKDAQGSYLVAGKGEPVFYINGQKVYNNAVLDGLNPGSIKDVEIIRNPGVSYGANIAAVVKIMTQKDLGDGFSTHLRSSYYYWTNSDWTEQFNWNYRKKGFDVFGNHSYRSLDTKTKSDLTQTLYAQPLLEQINRQEVLEKSRIFLNTIGINYRIDDRNNLGMKYNLDFPLNALDTGTFDSQAYTDGNAYDQLASINSSLNKGRARHHINAYFRSSFGDLTFGADCDFLDNSQSNFNTFSEESENFQDRVVHTLGKVSNRLFATKVFSELDLSRWSFSLGWEYSRTNRKNTYDNDEHIIDSRSADIFETHLSPYFDATCTIGDYQISGGVRYEKVWTKDRLSLNSPIKNYSNAYPNISMYIPIRNINMLVSYSIKDKKPSYSMLRNEITYGNRFTYQTGNPYLKPEKIHNVNFSMAYKWIQFAFDYTDRRDAILYSSDFYTDNKSIALISFCNVQSLKNIAGSFSFSPSIGIWNTTLTIAITKQWFTAHTEYGNFRLNKPIFLTSLSNILNFDKGWRAYLDFKFTSKGDNENSRSSRSAYGVDFRIYKYFMHNSLSLSIAATDMFDSQKNGIILFMHNLKTTQTEWRDSREICLTLSYRFNTAKDRYKGRSAGKEEQSRL